MGYNPRTLNDYDLFEAVSALQKEIRRGNKYEAVFWGLELHESRFTKYLWKRLMVISVEDIQDIQIPIALKAIKEMFDETNDKKPHRIFITRAIVMMCEATKNRNVDHYQNLRDKKLERGESLKIPEYALDVHTKQGKMNGKTKLDFFKEEYEQLQNTQEDEQDKLVAQSLFDLL